MKLSRLDGINVALVLAMVAMSAVAYPFLPETMWIHWNIRGQPDGSASRAVALSIIPLVSALLIALLIAVKKRAGEGGRRAFERVSTATIVFLGALHAVVIAIGLGKDIAIDRFMFLALGALFVAIGFWMKNLPRNGVIGVRTPWTLRSDEVWTRTHKFSRPIFIVCGALFALFAFIGVSFQMLLLTLGAIVVLPIAYSWYASRRLT